MPSLTYYKPENRYIWRGTYEDRLLAQNALFDYADNGIWRSHDPFKAYRLLEYADASVMDRLLPIHEAIQQSLDTWTNFSVPCPDGLSYFDYQRVSVEASVGRKTIMITDDMGVGKTIQAIAIANYEGRRNILVICPASIRLKWKRELEKWHMFNPGAAAVLKGNYIVNPSLSTVVSYEMAVTLYDQLVNVDWDMVVIDEFHYLKNPDTKRTKYILGDPQEEIVGLAQKTDKLVELSGTPMTNRANELYPVLSKTMPDAINNQDYWAFVNTHCDFYEGDHGYVFNGTKNEWLLYNRLRGSGSMVRRKKAVVLPQLPAKTYSLIHFPQDSETRKIIEKEKQFSVEEIIGLGVSNIPGLPEVVREMGVAKAPLVAQYVIELLQLVDKVLIGVWHRDVFLLLAEMLQEFDPVGIIGSTSPTQREWHIDQFQTNPDRRVFVGQLKAAGEGIDLTAASEVVLAETYWTPNVCNQFIDRAHRIGQNQNVHVHIPVVDGSLDSYILSTALDKQEGQDLILDGVI